MSSTENLITTSPFYRDNENKLPYQYETILVQQGQLYMMDDAGGVVFQTFTPGSVNGTLNLGTKVATFEINNNNLCKAKSYKVNSTGSDHIVISNNNNNTVTINDLVESGRALLLDGTNFRVETPNEGESFYVYNVHDKNGQLAMIHKSAAVKSNSNTQVEVHGLLYVQVSDDGDPTKNKVYIGIVKEPIQLTIEDDSHDDFIPNP